MRAVLLICFSSAALAQTGGGITGTISDHGGAPISNVGLQVKNNATGATRSVQSDSEGNYALTDLPVGDYQLMAAAPGLAPFVQPKLDIEAGKSVRIDIRLDDVQLNTLGEDRD